MNSPPAVFARYQDLQRYVAWTSDDEQRVVAAGGLIAPHIKGLVDDFYAEIERHPAASEVITGGAVQIARLKQSLTSWVRDLFAGPYDESYVLRRWRVGQRHVEIGLPQVYTAAAFSRLRNGMLCELCRDWRGGDIDLVHSVQSLNKLLDLDLAIISDAYETEHVERQQEAERRRVQDVLHQERELSAGLFAHAQAIVLILDKQGQIVRWNPYLERLIGSGPLMIRDGDWFTLFLAPEDRPRVREALLAARAASDLTPVTASTILERDGQQRHLHWSAAPLRDAAGMPFAILAVGHDVTDLHAAQQRALQAERLAAIGQMAAGLAHESRSALQRIGAAAEMLETELEKQPNLLKLVGRIQQSQERLHHLLDEVRNYSAPVVLDRSPLRISEAWREAWELLTPQRAGRSVKLVERIIASNLSIDGDRFRLVQVFRNILENALAACSDPVKVEITCESSKEGGSPVLRVRVSDNGPGLGLEQRRRIFEPFYTTKPTGTGLGMAIAQRIVESHGGHIAIGGEPGSGAEVIVNLPVSQP